MIFRDDIRCIEHCLKALQPLRDKIPCQLVMADTGSKDGSREVAEKYADILFDFPWINDFAAARNAVLEQCTGEWYLTVDSDEYLEDDFSELIAFLNSENSRFWDYCTVIIRNYDTYEMDGDYTDFVAQRMVRMALNPRYGGSIHEGWTRIDGKSEIQIHAFTNVVFAHDGYVGLSTEAGKEKRERNVTLLRQRIQEAPQNLLLRQEMMDSATGESDYTDIVRSAVNLLKTKPETWEIYGPPLLRNAIFTAQIYKFPELDEWVQIATEWFPESLFTRIDVEYVKFVIAKEKKDYASCIIHGELYMKAMEDMRAGLNMVERMYGVFSMASPTKEQGVKISLASACCIENQFDRTLELLTGLDYSKIQPPKLAELISTLHELQYKNNIDTSSMILSVWDGIRAHIPSQTQAEARMNIFYQIAALTFVPGNQKKAAEKKDFCRNSYTLYLPLRGKDEVGNAAAVMEATNPLEMESILSEVEEWNHFPIHALAYAIEQGARFPLPDKTMNIEELDSLAGRLSGDRKRFLPLALNAAEAGQAAGGPLLAWARGLMIAAIQTFDWKGTELDAPPTVQEAADEKERIRRGLELARAFAQTEKQYLPSCYIDEVLTEERLYLLPPMHRFGWYCAQAFEELDEGHLSEYVRLLRRGLETFSSVKQIAEFLLEHTPELKKSSDELRTLADQIRAILSTYAPDDPTVALLKQSEAYQKVAYYIEGAEVPTVGKCVQ